MIVGLDHSQLEPRIQAHLYSELGDDSWAEVYWYEEKIREKYGPDHYDPKADIYAVVGSRVYRVKLASINRKEHPVRDKSKPIVLGMSYGLTEFGLAKRIGSDVDYAKEVIAKTFRECPGMGKYYKLTREELIETECIETMFGLKRHLPWKHRTGRDRKWAFKRAFRQAVNVKIQGPGSDLTLSGIVDFEEKYAGLEIIRTRNFGCILVAEVHDNAIMDMKTAGHLKALKWHMENPSLLDEYEIKFRVPLAVDEKRANHWK